MSINIPHVPTIAYDQAVWNRQVATMLNRVVSETNNQTPAGIFQQYGGVVAPDGWLFCDGSAVSRSICSYLFTAIGTAYGPGDGSTTFNLPDISGLVLDNTSPDALSIDTMAKFKTKFIIKT